MFAAHECVHLFPQFMHSKHSVINFLSRFIRRDPFYLFSTFIIFRRHRSCIRAPVWFNLLYSIQIHPSPTSVLTNSINTNRFCRRRAFLLERRLRSATPQHMLENTFLSTGREMLFVLSLFGREPTHPCHRGIVKIFKNILQVWFINKCLGEKFGVFFFISFSNLESYDCLVFVGSLRCVLQNNFRCKGVRYNKKRKSRLGTVPVICSSTEWLGEESRRWKTAANVSQAAPPPALRSPDPNTIRFSVRSTIC